jgi:hypothetical protein
MISSVGLNLEGFQVCHEFDTGILSAHFIYSPSSSSMLTKLKVVVSGFLALKPESQERAMRTTLLGENEFSLP